jgi:hypothetical protein
MPRKKKTALDNGVRTQFEDIMTLEDGTETLEESVQAMQRLINSGQCWHLQGSFGRAAMDMIESGYCTVGPKMVCDYYGGTVPSTEMLEAGTKGTIEYCRKMQPEYWAGRNDDHSINNE